MAIVAGRPPDSCSHPLTCLASAPTPVPYSLPSPPQVRTYSLIIEAFGWHRKISTAVAPLLNQCGVNLQSVMSDSTGKGSFAEEANGVTHSKIGWALESVCTGKLESHTGCVLR